MRRWSLSATSRTPTSVTHALRADDGTTARVVAFDDVRRRTVEFDHDLAKYGGAAAAAELAAHVYRAASGDRDELLERARRIVAGLPVSFSHVEVFCEEIPSGRIYVGGDGVAAIEEFFGVPLDVVPGTQY